MNTETLRTLSLCALLSSALAGCSSKGDVTTFLEVVTSPSEGFADFEVEEILTPDALEAPEAAPPVALFPTSVVFAPTPELLPYVQASARMYAAHGLQVDIAPWGIPIEVVPTVKYKDTLVDALAHYDRECSFDACEAGNVWIIVAEVMLHEKEWALQSTIDHEIGHVLSGWGKPAGLPMHLPEGNMMGPGCRKHVCFPWTDLDEKMICAGGTCR